MSAAPVLRRIALLVEYDGAAFAGSQSQPRLRTVQDTLEAALQAFIGEQQRMKFAGRTDSGVHARGQVVTLDTATAHSPLRVREALNHFLPPDVAVRAVCAVSPDFDVRRDAQSRRYIYRMQDGRSRSPLNPYAWQIDDPLDEASMAQAAALLPLTPCDWSAFAGPLETGRSPVRTLQSSAVRRCGAHRLALTLEGESFLPHQVRRIAGALRDVGLGRLTPDEFARLRSGPPSSAGPSAPPQGLTLEAVSYAQGMVDWHDNDEDIPAA